VINSNQMTAGRVWHMPPMLANLSDKNIEGSAPCIIQMVTDKD
jgi:hypothetical protein